MCEERAQGSGATTVCVMRHRTRARRGDGIPPTKYRAADGGCSAREESRFSPEGETNACAFSPAPEGAMRGFVLGRSRAEPSKTRRVAQDCDPKTYMYMSSGRKDALIGRFSRASTVARNKAARWKANQNRILAPAEPADAASLSPLASTCRTSSKGCRLRPCRSSRRGSSSRGRARPEDRC